MVTGRALCAPSTTLRRGPIASAALGPGGRRLRFPWAPGRSESESAATEMALRTARGSISANDIVRVSVTATRDIVDAAAVAAADAVAVAAAAADAAASAVAVAVATVSTAVSSDALPGNTRTGHTRRRRRRRRRRRVSARTNTRRTRSTRRVRTRMLRPSVVAAASSISRFSCKARVKTFTTFRDALLRTCRHPSTVRLGLC